MISQELFNRIEKLANSINLNIYDISQLKENDIDILRISITKKAPLSIESASQITLQECQNLSELLSPMLDVEYPMLNKYHLEVSSPGLERVLKIKRHYTFSLGELAKITLNDKTKIQGILHSFCDDSLEILVDKKPQKLLLDSIKKTKVIFV